MMIHHNATIPTELPDRKDNKQSNEVKWDASSLLRICPTATRSEIIELASNDEKYALFCWLVRACGGDGAMFEQTKPAAWDIVGFLKEKVVKYNWNKG